MTNEIVLPVQVAYLIYALVIGVIIFFTYLALFYFLFTYTKNPRLKYIFGFVLVSLMKLIPESWKKEARKQARKNKK